MLKDSFREQADTNHSTMCQAHQPTTRMHTDNGTGVKEVIEPPQVCSNARPGLAAALCTTSHATAL